MAPHRPTLRKSLRAIERAFADIENLFAEFAKRVRVVERKANRKARKMQVFDVGAQLRRRLEISPKRRAQLKLQGQYMGYMRQLGPRQKARVKAVKAKRGFGAAIKVARRLAK